MNICCLGLLEWISSDVVPKTHEPNISSQFVEVASQVHVETGTDLRAKQEGKRHALRSKLSTWHGKAKLHDQRMLLHLPDRVFLHKVFSDLKVAFATLFKRVVECKGRLHGLHSFTIALD